MARTKLDLPDRFAYAVELPVRITDINYGQHLGNDALLALLHEARVRWLRHLGRSEQDVGGCGLIMVDAVLVYKAQVAYGAVLVVALAARDFTPLGCDIVYRVTDQATGAEVARAKTGIVAFDYARGRPARLPDAFRAALENSSP